MLLAKGDFTMSVLMLRELFGKNEKAISQKKARIIGRQGKVRSRIEKDTGAHISVYGNTIAMIGSYDETENAEFTIQKILDGASIKTAFELLKEKTQWLKYAFVSLLVKKKKD